MLATTDDCCAHTLRMHTPRQGAELCRTVTCCFSTIDMKLRAAAADSCSRISSLTSFGGGALSI